MKKSIIFLLILLFSGFICNAQTDSSKIISDTLSQKVTKAVPVDSLLAKPDTMKYALLYVYRPKNMLGFAISYDLKVSNAMFKDMSVGRVKNNTKFIVKLYQEGPTEILARTEAKSFVNVNVKFGAKYFLKCGLTTGLFVGRPELSLIYPEQGELDYTNM